MRTRLAKLLLSLALFFTIAVPSQALANNPAATAAGLAIDLVVVGLQAAIAADQPIAGGKVGEAAAKFAEKTGEKIVDPLFATVMREVFWNVMRFVTDRLAYDAAVALSSAGSGQTPLVYFESPKAYWEQLGMDVVGETIGSLDAALESVDLKFGLCTPQDPVARLSLQIGLANAYGASRERSRPKCEFRDFLNNINAIGARYAGEEFGTQTVLRQFANAWRPGQNELSASISLNLAVHQEVNLTKQLGVEELFAKDGFKDVVDVITGKVLTPSELIKEEAKYRLNTAKKEDKVTQLTIAQISSGDPAVLKQMGLSAISTFANTLLSGLANRLYQGIFNPPSVRFDPFNPTASVPGGRERAQETFRSILAAPIISFDDYNIVNEFVICPGDDLRGLNNCVMDQAFAVALSRAKTGQPLTVKEAIDEGYLNGGWPLIPSKDEGRNQDIRCSSYGYCYANLVKMRKARVIPVGWELAADSPWNEESSPVTLQDAVDGFFNCNDEGQADATHPWCHLIDPNWILKIPPAQCRAFVPSELPVSGLINARQSVCVDSPTCIDQDADGNCVGGYGYCTEERNTWQFRGDSCPADYAGCLAFNNVRTGGSGTYLLNTVNTQGCSADNAGCRWYRTNKYEDDQDTPELTDDTFEFLPTGATYVVADHDDDVDAFEDRLYMNQNAGVCSAEAAGCTELVSAETTRLNLLRNPSFEKDEDEDGVPDGWSLNYPSVYDTISGEAFQGTSVLTSQTNAIVATQSEIPLSPNRFYTLSAYVKNEVSISGSFLVQLFSEDSVELVNLNNTTTLGDCMASGNTVEIAIIPLSIEDEYERKTCTFTTPSFATRATVFALFGTGGIFVDALQLELGSVAGTFQEGYGSGLITREYLTVPPAWMGCTGAASDPAECSAYTRVCSAQDVGCDLYTPATGGFGVPAVTSAADTCPNECVGYETYKQEATPYEAEDFPLFFIATSAQVCSQADVGCDAYTNLNEVALGGEGIEYYSGLRFCAQPSQNTGSTFYTWEGTEAEGFQLRAWQLLESNLNDARDTNYVEGTTTVFSEVGVGLAPCTHSVVTSETTVACQDVVRNTTETNTYTDCNEHADAISNPDCREFYDSAGNIHYRLLSQTAVISDSCAPYRKDNGTQNDCTTSGGFWTGGGSCRYFVLGSESNACSEAAAGCRAYTGASGRNASTIFADTVEDDTLNEYTSVSPATISNESVAAGGHSIRVNGAQLNMLSLVEAPATISAGDANTNGQCDAGELCTLREGSSGSTCQVAGTDTDGVDDCGPMVGRLVQGKTYIVEFWAKGVGAVTPRFVADRGVSGATTWDIGDAAATPPANSVALTGGWQLYSVGPLDTSDATLFADFDDTAILRFFATGASYYFIDNIVLKETEENLALIKDSWVTPSTCDLSPTGTPSPQHYLGCQAYTDRAGTEQNLYQFTRLCSEEVIGCSAYFDTQNSESAFGAVFNATCSRPSGSPIPVGAEACTMGDETVCTIAAGRSSCHFDFDGALPSPLPSFADGDDFDIVLGPEARVVSGDSDVFLVNKGNTTCGAASAGCTEVGLPDFSQDKAFVTGFETTYLLDDPDRYTTTLCDTEGLFCEAWSTKADGTFYFKDPADQTCDFKPSVTINNQNYSGWFRAGTNDPCYYEDLPPANGVFDVATELSTAYLISGIEFGIWRNGDLAPGEYDGWLATCPARYDRCAEFIDPMDTTGGQYPNGTPYVYIKNDKIEESSLSGGERCNGEVNLNEGCALFFDSIQPELLWNASASYIVSEHADILKGEAAQSSQSPISCAGAVANDPDTTTIDEGNDIGRILSSGIEFNVCQSRCRYDPEGDGVIAHPYARQVWLAGSVTYTTSCLTNNDCPTIKDSNNKSVAGECRQAYEQNSSGLQPVYDQTLFRHIINFDDVNDVRKVARDRQCSEWLTCSSTIQVWDDRIGRYREICDQIGACTQYSKMGDVNICNGFAQAPALPLSQDRYVNRDVSWWGEEFSGYAIPGNIPTQLLDQVNINHAYACSGQPNLTCSEATEETDCAVASAGECVSFDEDIRLAYNAGTCNSGDLARGSACYVGTCEDSGFACSSDSECDTDTGEQCEIGFCENTQIGVSCSEATEATVCDQGDPNDPNDNFSCQSGLCKQQTGTTCSPNDSPSSCATSPSVSGQCILEETSFRGGCFANNCLLAADGTLFGPGFTNAVECKAYPEQNSPYPHRVAGGSDPFDVLETTGIVTQWVDPFDSDQIWQDFTLDSMFTLYPDSSPENDWIAYTKRPGFQGIQTCAPNGEDCSCTYQKVTYGNGIKTKYYGRDVDSTQFLTGVCLGGELEGKECGGDVDCNPDEAELLIGRCVKPTSVETMLGVDGYCLERDTAINKWKDPNKTFGGECLTWLPVDQLTGSNDIYNSYTSAGQLLDQDVLYCTETALYADLYVTGSLSPGEDDNQIANGCAETKTGLLNCTSLNGYHNCTDNTHCPKGYFAIVGSCDLTLPSPAYNCVTGGGDQAGSDDDCPYFCVPEDAQDFTGGDAVCDEPSSNPSGTNGSGTPYFKVGSGFEDRLEQYRFCAKFGARIPEDYERLIQLAVQSPQDGYFQANADIPYLACEETVQVSDADDGNKAWTNRLWSDASFSLQDTEDPIALEYQVTTEPIAPYGRVDTGVLEKVGNNWERVGAQKLPVAIESCIAVASGNYTVALADSSCTPAPTPGEARSYETLSAEVSEDISSFPTCGNVGGNAECNGEVSCQGANNPAANGACFKKCDPTSNPPPHSTSWRVNINGEDEPNSSYGCWYDPDENGDAYTSLGDCVTLGSTNPNVDPDSGGVYVCEIPSSLDGCEGSGSNPDAGTDAAKGVVDETPGLTGSPDRVDTGFCAGGDWDASGSKAWCEANIACYDSLCVGTLGQRRCVGFGNTSVALSEIAEGSPDDDSVTATEVIRQIFAKVFDFFQYQPGGVYELVTGSYDAASPGDISEDPDDYLYPSLDPPPPAGTAPIVRGLDDCFSSGCREAGDDTVTVNGVTGGTILGDEGAAHVSVQFFAEANANQLPIRNVIVNFGDGHKSGSTGPANYYKNRRGLDQNNEDQPFCNANTKWGETSASCEPNYFTFTHDYVCTEARVATLPSCSDASADRSDGCSTSDGLCQFVPRVHVKDNWGYCTGACGTSSGSPAGTACYDDTSGDAGWAVNECDLECDGDSFCTPLNNPLLSGQTINPWIYYDGAVRVEP